MNLSETQKVYLAALLELAIKELNHGGTTAKARPAGRLAVDAGVDGAED
jgi:hypothetical protein